MQKIYFMMSSQGHEVVFLFVSEDHSKWELEKRALEQGKPDAFVIDMVEMTVTIQQVKIQMVNGGPVALLS